MLGNAAGRKIVLYTPDYIAVRIRTNGSMLEYADIDGIDAIKVERGIRLDEYMGRAGAGTAETKNILSAFIDFIGDLPLVGYNLDEFGMKILCRETERIWGKVPDNEYIDILQLSKAFIPGLEDYSLETLAQHYEIENFDPYRDMSISRAIIKIYENLGHEMI